MLCQPYTNVVYTQNASVFFLQILKFYMPENVLLFSVYRIRIPREKTQVGCWRIYGETVKYPLCVAFSGVFFILYCSAAVARRRSNTPAAFYRLDKKHKVKIKKKSCFTKKVVIYTLYILGTPEYPRPHTPGV